MAEETRKRITGKNGETTTVQIYAVSSEWRHFEDTDTAKQFYTETLGLRVSDEERGRYAKFDGGPAFMCLERKGSEYYPSRDKAVLFFEVPDLQSAIAAIGPHRFARTEQQWAVLHDPEGHNVLLLQAGSPQPSTNLS